MHCHAQLIQTCWRYALQDSLSCVTSFEGLVCMMGLASYETQNVSLHLVKTLSHLLPDPCT